MNGPEFAGLRAVVTGGAAGIGLAAARLLAARGARVACLDLDPRDLPEPLVRAYADVTDEHSVRAGLAWAAELLGGIGVLVNSAGTGTQLGVEHGPDHAWRRTLEVNVLGVLRTTRTALPYLRQSPTPAVVNICSTSAGSGPARILSSASEGAVLAITRALAAELVDDAVRVTCVNPGTAVAHDEVAAAIAYLASPLSGTTTGTQLAVNGATSGPLPST
jgi:NAD(P)-dependent dehydrogenase (short-subunit alcohol dehydrogenase family)